MPAITADAPLALTLIAAEMGDAYPELKRAQPVKGQLREEEERCFLPHARERPASARCDELAA
ncbi:MAG: hypothetical protein R3C27_11655 [Hyphomonadaceae bacterium]